MNVVIGLIVTSLLLVGVLWVAFQSAHWGEDGQVPTRRPTWLGPDAVAIAKMLQDALAAERTRASLPELLHGKAIDELAKHHAFDMATRGYAAEEDPDGEDLGGRRHRLHPGYVGRMWEFDALLEPSGPSTEESLFAEIRRTPAWSDGLLRAADPAWNAVGVGVAIERGRCAVCLVFGAWWATVERVKPGEAWSGGWKLEGDTAPGVPVAELTGQLADADPVAATPHDNPEEHPRVFTLVLPWDGDAVGLKATIRRGEEPGLVQTML